MGPNEPYWQTNTSFSPPPSRWDFRLQPEGLSFESTQQYGSSMSSNSRGSRSWLRSNQIFNQQSEGAGPYFSSPSEFSPRQQWTPPAIQEIKVDDYGTSSTKVLGSLSLSPSMEGTSEIQDSRSSISTPSDNSDNEQPIHKSNLSSHLNFPSRRYFMHKPIHPLSFSSHTPTREAHASSFTNYSKSQEADFKTDRCGLCERFLSQRSPWSSRRIVKCGDMPIAGILSCRHVFHAECLDQTTPKTHKNDPPCPICLRLEEQHSQEVTVCPKVKNGFLKIKSFSEDGPSRPWGCAQAGDCVEGALHAPPRSTMLLLNRNRVRNSLSLKGKQYPGKSRKIGSHQGGDSSSKTVAGPSM